MSSFEEFHTSQKRQRAWKEAIQKDLDRVSLGDTIEMNGSKQDETRSTMNNIGAVLERVELQMFFVGLIYLELVAATMIFVLEHDVGTLTNTAKIEKIADVDSTSFRLLTAILNFTNFCFVIDSCCLLYAFGLKTFSHIGYSVDFCIILTMLWNQLNNSVLDLYFPVQFLGFLRFWRVARLISTMVSKVEHSHKDTKSKLQNVKIQLKNQTIECNRLEALKSNEIDLRKQVEKLVQAYKDEVETLKEALKIAALDVAAAAEESFNEDPMKEVKGEIDMEGDEFFDGE